MDNVKTGHFNISWRPLYERFFKECVWTMDRAGMSSGCLQEIFDGKDIFSEYLKKARYDVLMARRWAEGLEKEGEIPKPRPGCMDIPT